MNLDFDIHEFDRMCETHRYRLSHCKATCPIRGYTKDPPSKFSCLMHVVENDLAHIAFNKWIAENPPPKYPTWREWFTTVYPLGFADEISCPQIFVGRDNWSCDDCIGKDNECSGSFISHINEASAAILDIKPKEE